MLPPAQREVLPHLAPTAPATSSQQVAADQAPAGPPSPEPLKLMPGARRTRLDVLLTVLHVQVPRGQRELVEPLWNHLREDVADNGTALRLKRNGVRVGVGREQWWEAIRAILDAVPGVRTTTLDPVRLPANYPLALELDERPRDQTLFFVADDGVLTGETWVHSRNVLRVSYDLNLADPTQVRLLVVPEVRQRLDGWRWVRSAVGLVQMPNYEGRAFAAAAVATPLEPGQFLLLAPGQGADVCGLVGGAFLSREIDDQRFDSYVFLRADMNYVARGN